MTMLDMPPEAKPAVRLRQRREIDEIDYRRELLLLASKYTQRQVAHWLRITQPSLCTALKTAKATPMPREGFSGASPKEICQRYAADLISREQMVDELTRWEYAPMAETDGYDSLLVDAPGSFAEVIAAADAGVIEADVYDEVVEKLRND